MNQAPSNQQPLATNNNTFSSQPATPQTNPFTADMRGEFTSNFGTNTNAVSQIFKEGGFTSNNRTKYIVIGAVVLLVAGLAFFLLSEGGSDTDEAVPTDEAGEATEEGTTDEPATEEQPTEEAVAETPAAETPVVAETPAATAPTATGPISLSSPSDGSSRQYDETSGPAEFTWSGGGGHIIFSRSASMTPETMRVAVSGNSYYFQHPYPGKWYWKVENASGSSDVRSFTVTPAARRNIQLAPPSGPLSGNGGTVTWQGDSKVAFYRVELSTGSWANPQFRFATSGTSAQLKGVAAGSYQMRVGAFSEVSGRWEYTAPVAVTVQ